MRVQPRPPAPGDLRWLRSAFFGAAMTMLALLAHAAAGGMLPPGRVALAAGAVLTAGTVPLTRRERGPATILAATGTAQVLLHLTFTIAMARGCLAGGASGMAAMGSGSLPTRGCTGQWLDASAVGGSHPALVMVGAHALASVLLAWWLQRGERLVGRLVGLAAPLVLALAAWCRTDGLRTGRVVDASGPRGPRSAARVAVPESPGLSPARKRRGPPGVAAA